MTQNPNCDGSHCRHEHGEVRLLPTGGDSNVILCADCFQHETAWRKERNRELEESCRFALPKWSTLTIYLPATRKAESGHAYKLYECNQCGCLKSIQTNHFGKCYSWRQVNVCPECPPFRRPTTWVCVEPKPDGAWVPEPWQKVTLTIKTV